MEERYHCTGGRYGRLASTNCDLPEGRTQTCSRVEMAADRSWWHHAAARHISLGSIKLGEKPVRLYWRGVALPGRYAVYRAIRLMRY